MKYDWELIAQAMLVGWFFSFLMVRTTRGLLQAFSDYQCGDYDVDLSDLE